MKKEEASRAKEPATNENPPRKLAGVENPPHEVDGDEGLDIEPETPLHELVGVSPEHLAKLRSEHGKRLKHLALPLDDDGEEVLHVLSKVPNRHVNGQFFKYIDKNPEKAFEVIIKGCLLTGKERVLADDDLFNTAASAIAETIPIRSAIIKNA